MPCFDKKLEAAQPALATPAGNDVGGAATPDVDCVLTTGELLTLLEAQPGGFAGIPEAREFDSLTSASEETGELRGGAMGDSG